MSWSGARNVALVLVILALALTLVKVNNQSTRITSQGHDAIQQNVNARFDDCESGNDLRMGLLAGVAQGRKTTPVLLRLVPSLNTAEVKALIRKSEARQQKAYKPRSCAPYALKSVPPAARKNYTTPKS